MKRLLGLVTAIMIVGSLHVYNANATPGNVTADTPVSGSAGGAASGAAAPAAGSVSGAGTGSSSSTASTLSETCRNILQESKSTSTGNVCTQEDVKKQDANDEIIVILGESITGNSGKYSCGQIVNCLREKYKTQKAAEGFVTCELRNSYKQCIVSGKDGLGLLSNYASQVYNWIAGIVGSICILVIIISGIQISIGGLSQEEVSSAKDRVVRALAGLVVLFLSAFILYTINPFFFT